MADSLQHLIDSTVAYKVDSTMLIKADLITKIDAFYNSAWDKLVLIISISGAVVGILIPYITQWYQRREMRANEEMLKKAIIAHADELMVKQKEAISATLSDQLATHRATLSEEIGKVEALANGAAFYLQAKGEWASAAYKDSLISSMNAADNLVDAGNLANISSSLEAIKLCLAKINSKELKEAEAQADITIAEILARIDKQKYRGAFVQIMSAIRLNLEKLRG